MAFEDTVNHLNNDEMSIVQAKDQLKAQQDLNNVFSDFAVFLKFLSRKGLLIFDQHIEEPGQIILGVTKRVNLLLGVIESCLSIDQEQI